MTALWRSSRRCGRSCKMKPEMCQLRTLRESAPNDANSSQTSQPCGVRVSAFGEGKKCLLLFCFLGGVRKWLLKSAHGWGLIRVPPHSLGNPIKWKLQVGQAAPHHLPAKAPHSLGNPIKWKLLTMPSLLSQIRDAPHSLGNPIKWKHSPLHRV